MASGLDNEMLCLTQHGEAQDVCLNFCNILFYECKYKKQKTAKGAT